MITLDVADNVRGSELVAEVLLQPPTLQISVLGPLTIRRGDVELTAANLGGPKPRQVLEILLMNFGSAVSKTRIMDLLWNGKHPAVALPTLESYVSVLRRHLQPGTGRSGPLRTVTGGYVLDPALVDLDLHRFEVLSRRAAHAAPAEALVLLTEALELATAPLLGDEVLPTWAEDERLLHAARVNLARVSAAEAALSVGEVERAITWAGAAAEEDPLNERAWTALVLGLERNGESTRALRTYSRCRKIIDDELGCAPGPALREAHARLRGSTATTHASAGITGSATHAPQVCSSAKARVKQEPRCLRVLIADGHTTFCELLAGALDREADLRSVGAADSVDSAVAMYRDQRPDVVLLDLHLADGSGLTAAERILAESPSARIVMLTGAPTQEALRKAARMGICGFLPKEGSLETVLDTLRHVHPGNMIVHPSLFSELLSIGAPVLEPVLEAV